MFSFIKKGCGAKYLGALQVQLTQADFEEIERISPKGSAAGGRLTLQGASQHFNETLEWLVRMK